MARAGRSILMPRAPSLVTRSVHPITLLKQEDKMHRLERKRANLSPSARAVWTTSVTILMRGYKSRRDISESVRVLTRSSKSRLVDREVLQLVPSAILIPRVA